MSCFNLKEYMRIGLFFAVILAIPLSSSAQDLSTVKGIDSAMLRIDNDRTLVRRIVDTTTYEKEDGGTHWDSAYHHRELFYKGGQLVKVIAWNKYQGWRNDMTVYFDNGKAITFSKGESFQGHPNYGALEFRIYYFLNKAIHVEWLQPKPENVLGVDTDIFLKWAYGMRN